MVDPPTVLLCILFASVALLAAQQTALEPCDSPWYISVDKELTVSWTGDDRTAAVQVNWSTDVTHGQDCVKNESLQVPFVNRSLHMSDPCSNTVYEVTSILLCDGKAVRHSRNTVRTPPDAPKNIQMSSTNVSVTSAWVAPPGQIEKYKIKLNGMIQETTQRSYTIHDLIPYTWYTVSICASNEEHWGRCSNSQSVRTLVGVPSEPRNLTVASVKSDFISLEWLSPEPVTGPDIQYQVQWKEAESTEPFKKANSANTTYSIKTLHPYTEYFIQVAAFTTAGQGVWTNITVNTSLAVPNPPQMEVTDTTNTSVSVRWKMNFYRGPVPTYGLRWKATSATVSYQTKELGSEENNYSISDLQPYTAYGLQIRATNNAGVGRWSDMLEFRTKIGVPSSPRNIFVSSMSANFIVIAWDEPVPSNGPILKYKIQWRREKGNWQENFKEDRQFSATSLTPYTDYEFIVCAQTEVGWGTCANTFKVVTNISTPSVPVNLTVSRVTNTSIFLQWIAPEKKNGPSLKYYMKWNTLGDESLLEDENATTAEYPGSVKVVELSTKYEIQDLQPYTNYSVAVAAATDAGLGPYTEPIVIQTTAGIPTAPSNVRTTKVLPTSIELKWSEPGLLNGPLSSYVIHWGIKGTVGSIVRIQDRSYAALGLRPYTPYFFRIAAATEGGEGPFEVIYLTTSTSTPSAPKRLKTVVVTDHTIFLNWMPPEHPSAPFLTYTIRWQKVLDGPHPTQVHETNLTIFTIRDLSSDSNYSVEVRATNEVGEGPWTDALYVCTLRKDYSSMVIAGSIVGGMVMFFIIVLVILFLVAKRKGGWKYLLEKKKKKSAPSPDVNQSNYSIPMDSIPTNFGKETTSGINIRNFDQHVLKLMSNGYAKLGEEFGKLNSSSPAFSTDEAKRSDNLTKNRWMKILPFDYSRVKLLPVGDEVESDYINASYIPGDSHMLEYIATQGPLPNTMNDFWRMVWQQSIFLIVMLTQCVERAKKTCEKYWPSPGGSCKYGEGLEVHTISESITPAYVVRLFVLSQGSKQRNIVQLHYMGWPVSGCPKSPNEFLSFIKVVRGQMSCAATGPTLVHCSAGIGRTGTYIAVDRLARQIVSNREDIDVYGTALELRRYRPNMVQTEEQYYFIHLCLQRLTHEKRQELENDYGDRIYVN